MEVKIDLRPESPLDYVQKLEFFQPDFFSPFPYHARFFVLFVVILFHTSQEFGKFSPAVFSSVKGCRIGPEPVIPVGVLGVSDGLVQNLVKPASHR